jgi:hypothetical protein
LNNSKKNFNFPSQKNSPQKRKWHKAEARKAATINYQNILLERPALRKLDGNCIFINEYSVCCYCCCCPSPTQTQRYFFFIFKKPSHHSRVETTAAVHGIMITNEFSTAYFSLFILFPFLFVAEKKLFSIRRTKL